MGVVCESKQVAAFFRDFSDYIHTQLKVEDMHPKLEHFKFGGKRIVGVLTLEDVIEKMLRVDIVDEGDREEAIMKMKQDKNESNLAKFMQMRYVKDPETVGDSIIEKLQKDGIYISRQTSGQLKRKRTFGSVHEVMEDVLRGLDTLKV